MNPKLKKWLLRPFLILLLLCVTTAGVLFLILTTQQEKLVNAAVKAVNAQLKGELVVEGSSISLLRNFPYVSIALHNGRLYDRKKSPEKPVLQVDRLYAGFSLPDLLNEKYNIRRLILIKGYVNVIREKQGRVNIVEATTVKKDSIKAPDEEISGSGEINLDKVILRDIHLSYEDRQSGYTYRGLIGKLISSLSMDTAQISSIVRGDVVLDILSPSDSAFFRDRHLNLDLTTTYHTKSNRVDVIACLLKLDDASLSIRGKAGMGTETDLDLEIKGENEDFNLITAFLPGDIKEKVKPFRYDGVISFDARLKGKMSDTETPLIEVNFGCREGWIQNKGSDRKVEELGFKGFYTNGKDRSLQTSELHIVNVNARPDKGLFHGNFVVRDFTHPRTLVQIRSELELRFLGEFFGIQDLKQITGTIKLDMDFKELEDIHLPEESLKKLREGVQSKLLVENLSFRIPNYPHAIRDMNLNAEMIDGKITVDSASVKVGQSNLRFKGSLSDIRAFLRYHDKPITLSLSAMSDKILMAELLSFDTALVRKVGEEVSKFNINLKLETSVKELLNPSPLPRGTLEMKGLNAVFKNYGHEVKNLSATVLINDTTLRLREFTGMIDSSDIEFKGRVNNYALWFNNIKKGQTQIAFDFKSKRFALKDVFTREVRRYLPRGYRREMLKDAWLRARIDLKYDTGFRFAKAKIANVTGELVRHKLKLTGISGHVKYGRRLLVLDTLRGKIGKSDFDITFKYFTGPDRQMKKRSNYLKFTSKFLDADEMSQYDLAPSKGKRRGTTDSTKTVVASAPVATVDSTKHKDAFNIFIIPFSDFNGEIDIAKLKYNRLWLKDVTARLRMQEDQHIYVDTLRMQVAGGTAAMRGHFNGTNPDKIYFRSRIKVDQVNLEKMMLKLDHFGQDVVINKNIKGRISGEIRSYVQVHPNFVPIMSKTKADLNLAIYNGTLVDFAPMQAMASYFKDKNLRLIRFDTLQNRLSFSEGVLDIPSMNINSSLGYIQMSGKQSLDLHMEYYVRVPLKVVTKAGLSGLFNKKHEEVDLAQVDEIEYLDKDKKIAFMNLKVVGKPEDFKVALGKDKKK